MAYPKRLLDDGEDVVLDLHPHWRVLALPALAVPVVVGLATFGAVAVDRAYATYTAIAVAVVVLVVTSVVPYVRWRTTHYVLTTRRVVIRTGLLAKQGRDIPLTRVNDVTFAHTAVERLFRSGTLTVESAGEHGQVVLTDIPRVEDVQRTLYRLVEVESDRRDGPPQTGQQHPYSPQPGQA